MGKALLGALALVVLAVIGFYLAGNPVGDGLSSVETTNAPADPTTEAPAMGAAPEVALSEGDPAWQPETFNLQTVVGAIEQSGLDDGMKRSLAAALQQAQNDPETLKSVLDQVKLALNL